MIKCKGCGYLLPRPEGTNYFSLFCAPPSFNINNSSLRHQFIKLQRLLHPDNYSSADERLQELSAKWSALLNQAYETLKDPQKRANYLYQVMTGKDVDGEDSTLDSKGTTPEIASLLAEVMEIRLDLEDAADLQQVQAIVEENRKFIDQIYGDLGQAFNNKDVTKIRTLLIMLRYRRSIEDVAKDILGTMDH